ncbi:MAG: carboxynorspermidine decarboxylase [Cytophagales bacterium]|nr:carboxynorspermidine decarboxylase [Cytophagales bacterium]
MPIDHSLIPSPCFVLDENKLIQNLTLAEKIQKEAGVEIILALKGFSMWKAFPIVRNYIKSAASSSLNEARLCVEEMKSKSHTYNVAFREEEFEEILELSSHIVFNSIAQFNKYCNQASGKVSSGLRVNPEWSDVKNFAFNPANPESRLGITSGNMPNRLPEGVEGLHFHVLCESNSFSLEKVLEHFEKKFGKYLDNLKWVNMGGGHLLSHPDYDVDHLISILKEFKRRHDLNVILEPGAGLAWEAGDLVTTVLDIVENGGVKTAIIDASFVAHMPDTLNMPYRPKVQGASKENIGSGFPYRIGGVSCLAGDFMEAYFFEQELHVGDRVVLHDMMHYTMVQSTTFNGVKHPVIGIWRKEAFELIREFEYSDFRGRLS